MIDFLVGLNAVVVGVEIVVRFDAVGVGAILVVRLDANDEGADFVVRLDAVDVVVDFVMRPDVVGVGVDFVVRLDADVLGVDLVARLGVRIELDGVGVAKIGVLDVSELAVCSVDDKHKMRFEASWVGLEECGFNNYLVGVVEAQATWSVV